MRKQRIKETNYFITETGIIINEKTRSILKPNNNGKGYHKVQIYIDGKRRPFYIHRLVADHFIKKPRKRYCDQVNHKDGDKSNNHYLNLEWVTNSENQKHKHKLIKNGREH